MHGYAGLADIENIDKLLDEIERAILTASALDRPFLTHLLKMAFWEARMNVKKDMERPKHRSRYRRDNLH